MEGPPRELLKTAVEASGNAYAPYSRFRVGAAVRDDEGRIHAGVNVENSSLGLTMCAERVAVFSAVSRGAKRIVEVLVYAADSESPIPPCGACLQVIAELGGPDTIIHMVSKTVAYRAARLRDLLPSPFKL